MSTTTATGRRRGNGGRPTRDAADGNGTPDGRAVVPTRLSLNTEYINARPIVVRAWKHVEIVLVGCGGTGGWLAPSLARLALEMRDGGKSVRLTFVDPDRVERANIPRQNFCMAEIGLDKASTLAARYGTAWGLEISAIPAAFEDKHLSLPHGVVPGDHLVVIVGCVDNAAARQSIANAVSKVNTAAARYVADGPPPVWWLDCGNGKESGQVLLGSASSLDHLSAAFKPSTICRSLPYPAMQRPELLEPMPDEQSDASTRLSCAQLAALHAQSLMVNQRVAAEASDYLLRLLYTGGLRRFATFIDLPSGVTKSFYSTPEAVAASVGKTTAIFGEQRKKGGKGEGDVPPG